MPITVQDETCKLLAQAGAALGKEVSDDLEGFDDLLPRAESVTANPPSRASASESCARSRCSRGTRTIDAHAQTTAYEISGYSRDE